MHKHPFLDYIRTSGVTSEKREVSPQPPGCHILRVSRSTLLGLQEGALKNASLAALGAFSKKCSCQWKKDVCASFFIWDPKHAFEERKILRKLLFITRRRSTLLLVRNGVVHTTFPISLSIQGIPSGIAPANQAQKSLRTEYDTGAQKILRTPVSTCTWALQLHASFLQTHFAWDEVP